MSIETDTLDRLMKGVQNIIFITVYMSILFTHNDVEWWQWEGKNEVKTSENV